MSAAGPSTPLRDGAGVSTGDAVVDAALARLAPSGRPLVPRPPEGPVLAGAPVAGPGLPRDLVEAAAAVALLGEVHGALRARLDDVRP